MKILHVISSPRGEESISIKLGNAVMAQLSDAYPESEISTKDLNIDPYPHLYDEQIIAMRSQTELTDAEKVLTKRSDEAIVELFDTDILVIGVPLYNFGIPSTLKNWIDNLLRAGKTFAYSSNGPEGLVKGKKVYIAIASGAVYSEGPYAGYDFAVPYLKAVLGFIGITDVEVVRAEGLGVSGLMETALEKGIESIVI